jgi:hypothetical protein
MLVSVWLLQLQQQVNFKVRFKSKKHRKVLFCWPQNLTLNTRLMNKMLCRCLFDITATGVTGHLKSSRMPFTDRSGSLINNDATWNRARNQQRNWETLTQIISLRTQVMDLTSPVKVDDLWQFEFATETPDAYGPADDPTSILRTDSAGVPMLLNLPQGEIMTAELTVDGPDQNIWFYPITINNE